MRVHWLQHVPFEGLGSIGPWLEGRGHPVKCHRAYAGDGLPETDAFDWLIVMGGPMNVDDASAYPWLPAEQRLIRQAIADNKRVLGICLGAQLMARALGARVSVGTPEIGWFDVNLTKKGAISPLLKDFSGVIDAFHWHGDCFAMPDDAVRLAGSAACANQAFSYGDRAIALQFHLETTPQSAGELIRNSEKELSQAPTIQRAEQMLSQPRRFAALNRLMDALLLRLEAA